MTNNIIHITYLGIKPYLYKETFLREKQMGVVVQRDNALVLKPSAQRLEAASEADLDVKVPGVMCTPGCQAPCSISHPGTANQALPERVSNGIYTCPETQIV